MPPHTQEEEQNQTFEIGKTFPIKFEFYKNAVNIGETRVSMLDPLSSEEKFISVVVNDPRTNKEVGKETWRKGNKETFVLGGLVTRRVEVVGREDCKEEKRKESQQMDESEKLSEDGEGDNLLS
uniref:Major sperm protein n=1 Tax=Meloidogyne javanica TaxID=6303 RepID=A0A915LZT5_MELJA